MKHLFSSVLSMAMLAGLVASVGTGSASAKACHDAKGRFMKCPTTMGSMMGKKHCRDAKGRFMKCHDSMMSAKKM